MISEAGFAVKSFFRLTWGPHNAIVAHTCSVCIMQMGGPCPVYGKRNGYAGNGSAGASGPTIGNSAGFRRPGPRELAATGGGSSRPPAGMGSRSLKREWQFARRIGWELPSRKKSVCSSLRFLRLLRPLLLRPLLLRLSGGLPT